jgi:rhodanese-related sulfurtransferase
MKKNRMLYLLFTMLIAFSMVMSACSPAPVEEAPVAEAPVEEAPAEEEPVVEEVLTLDDTFGTMLASMEGYNTIKADALLLEMAEDTPPFILDVRSVEEVTEQGHIEGAAHIPVNEIAQHIELLPSFDTSIVVYCGSGWRATIAMTALHGMGWENVRALKAFYSDWKEAGNPVAEGLPEAVALDAVEVDADILAAVDAAAMAVQGMGTKWGVQPADALNLALVENPDLVVIDVRRAEEVEEKGYIDAPNYVHIPLESFVADMAMWPATDAPITVYCGSGHRSTMAMTMLLAYGYEDVNSLKGGYGGWVGAGYASVGGVPTLAQNYSTMLNNMVGYNTAKADTLLLELVEDTPPFLLDVRSAAELEEQGHIEGATHIPLNELAQNLDLLPSFDTPIVAYCGSGWRATIAMTALHGMGWTDVRALKTTFADWVAAGNPVVEGLPEPMILDVASVPESLTALVDTSVVWAKDHGWGVKTAEDLNLALVDNPDLILIDVRTTGELEEKGVIAVVDQELIAIPLEGFIADMAMWPADKDAEIVVYCGSGHRSTMAMEILLTQGYTNVTSLKGGFGGWAEAGLPVAEYAATE